MENPICLITGATEGVGKFTAMELARRGFTVVMVARNAEKAEAVRKGISASAGNGAIDYIVGDLASLQQVARVAETFGQRYPRLDVLINNAGVFLPARTLTVDGFETTFQVNYLAHFLLTQVLLGELKKSEHGRIINLSSSVHSMAPFDVHNLQSEKQFSVMGTYATSKLLMLMSAVELARRLKDTRITANAVHPGIARTPMMRGAPGIFRLVASLSLPFSVSAEKGARTSVYLATSEDVEGVSGEYFAGSKMRQAGSRFNTPENREALWEISMTALSGLGLLPTGEVARVNG